LSKGGMHDRSNIVISCEECNRSKGAKLPQEFAGRLF
jgi:5-methylcytosine-specific restriction endonuclease McrA